MRQGRIRTEHRERVVERFSPGARGTDEKIGVQGRVNMNDSIGLFLEQFERVSTKVCAHVDEKLSWIKEVTGIERCKRADSVFWELCRDIIGTNPTHWNVAVYLEIGRMVAEKFLNDQWADVHKGAHYYNLGLAETFNGNVDGASRYFLSADRENEINKGTTLGGLFRDERLYLYLRTWILDPWFGATSADYHDGLSNWCERRDRIIKALGSVPGRYVVARCQAGLWRACFISRPLGWMSPPSDLDRVRAVEDMSVFCELVAREFDGTSDTLGRLLDSGRACANEGFAKNAGFRFAPDSTCSIDSLDTLRKARDGDRGAIAHVILSARNQAMHASEFADWYLQPDCLEDLIKVQLDFIASLAARHTEFAP